MERYINACKVEDIEKVNSLINDIFELSCSYTKSHCVKVRSCDKLERDIFALDCARFQLEMVLIHYGRSVEKFYDYKYFATSPKDDDYRCISNSFNALVTLWKNFCYNKFDGVSEFEYDFLDKAIENLVLQLKKTKRILIKNSLETDSYVFNHSGERIAL